MGYYDENGKLTIDEVVANRDIKRIDETIAKLKTSLDAIKAIEREDSQMEGAAAEAIMEKSQEMIKRIQKLIQNLENTNSFIRRTVKHYQQLDQDLKSRILASQTEAPGGGCR